MSVLAFAPWAQPVMHGPRLMHCARPWYGRVAIALSDGHQCQPSRLKPRASISPPLPSGTGGNGDSFGGYIRLLGYGAGFTQSPCSSQTIRMRVSARLQAIAAPAAPAPMISTSTGSSAMRRDSYTVPAGAARAARTKGMAPAFLGAELNIF